MRQRRLEVSGGALAVLALLYYLDDGGSVLWALLACVLHECGHWLAIRALGGRVSQLKVTCAGAELRLSAARPLSATRMALAALAGPGTNLLLAWGSILLARRGIGAQLYFFAGVNLGLAIFNLLPVGWLDGGRILESLLKGAGREDEGERVTELCSDIAAGLLLGAGLLLLWQSGGHNFTLLIAGIWVTAMARQEKRKGSL